MKLSVGTSPSPQTHVQEVGGGVETGIGRKSPSPHTRGVSQEHFWGQLGQSHRWDRNVRGLSLELPGVGAKAN